MQGKSVSALVREQIEKFLGEESSYTEAHKRISAIVEKNRGVLEECKREDLYDGQSFFDTNILVYEFDERES